MVNANCIFVNVFLLTCVSHGDHVIVHVWDVQCRDCASCLEKWEITVSPSPRAEPEVDNIQSGKPKTKMQIAFPRIPSNHSHPAPECTSQKLSCLAGALMRIHHSQSGCPQCLVVGQWKAVRQIPVLYSTIVPCCCFLHREGFTRPCLSGSDQVTTGNDSPVSRCCHVCLGSVFFI